MKELRPYQVNVINNIKKSFHNGNRRILVQLPTGAGKSIIFSKIIANASKKYKNVLFIVHRRMLIFQASSNISNEGIEHGIIMSKIRPSLISKTQLASIQTLWSRCHTYSKQEFPDADVIIIDEAHHSGSKTYVKIMENYQDSIIIGFTATPCRQNGFGLGNCFDDLILGVSVSKLMDLKYLAKATYMIPNIPNLKGVKVFGGDYVESEISKIMINAKLMGSIVSHYIKYAKDKKTIIFASSVSHSLALMDSFKKEGISIAHIDSYMSLDDRSKIENSFVNNEIKAITNVGIYTEGVDMPDVECIILARPTKSLGLYLQMCGRGLRFKKDGSECLILDHSGNYYRHGPVDEDHEWSLDITEKIQDRDLKNKKKNKSKDSEKSYVCNNCGNLFSKTNVCPKCGNKLERCIKDVEYQMGELIEAKKTKQKEITFSEMDRWYGMLLKYASEKEYKNGWVYHKFKAKFKTEPSKKFSKNGLLPSDEFKRYIQYLNIKAAKSAQKRKIS